MASVLLPIVGSLSFLVSFWAFGSGHPSIGWALVAFGTVSFLAALQIDRL